MLVKPVEVKLELTEHEDPIASDKESVFSKKNNPAVSKIHLYAELIKANCLFIMTMIIILMDSIYSGLSQKYK